MISHGKQEFKSPRDSTRGVKISSAPPLFSSAIAVRHETTRHLRPDAQREVNGGFREVGRWWARWDSPLPPIEGSI